LIDRGRAVARGSAKDVLRADLIERHYGAAVEVLAKGSGLVVIPKRPSHEGVLSES
jgi:ABC-type hemin transport system ATPase subunit